MIKKPLKIMQLNVDRDREETEDAVKYAEENKFDIIAMQEPYVQFDKREDEYKMAIPQSFQVIMWKSKDRGKQPKAAIIIVNKSLAAKTCVGSLSQQFATAIIQSKLVVIAAYMNKNLGKKFEAAPNKAEMVDELLRRDLDKLDEIIDRIRLPFIACADANARSSRWGEPVDKTDTRGAIMSEYLSARDLILLNVSELGATFRNTANGVEKKSFIDLTFTNDLTIGRSSWSFHKYTTNHRLIAIEIEVEQEGEQKKTTKKYNLKKLNVEKLIDIVKKNSPVLPKLGVVDEEKLEETACEFLRVAKIALEYSAPKRKGGRTGCPFYNSDLFERKKKIIQLRNQIEKEKDRERREELQRELRAKRGELKREKKKAKEEACPLLPRSMNEFWATMKRMRSSRREPIRLITDTDGKLLVKESEFEKFVLDSFIGDAKQEEYKIGKIQNEIDLLTGKELLAFSRSLPNRKAPGPDGLPNEVIKLIISRHLPYMVHLLNLMIRNVYIPKCWKEGELILLDKPGKDKTKLESYRPITLLGTTGKLLEKILVNRLRKRIDSELSSVDQHGFMRERSTMTAIDQVVKRMKSIKKRGTTGLSLAVDIKGAFDNLAWRQIFRALEQMGVQNVWFKLVKEMLIGRTVHFGASSRKLHKGCPQGGTGSPALWIIGSWPMLAKLKKVDGLLPVAFADDTNLIFEALGKRNLIGKFDKAKKIILEWCKFAGLTISHQKSQLVQFSGAPVGSEWCTLDGSNEIGRVDSMKYLGVIIDRQLSWKEHIKSVVKKTEKVNNALAWILRSCRTATIREKFALYRSVIVANVTYAGEFWSDVLQYGKYRRMINMAQRPSLLAITRAFRTTSYEKLYLVTGVIAFDLEVTRRRMVREKSKELRRKLTEEENREIDEVLRWENAKNFTKKLSVDVRMEFRDEICAELVYVLTEHGPFREFLCRIGRSEESDCRLCGEEEESVRHFQEGCEALKFRIAKAVSNEEELSELIENSKRLIGLLREMEEPARAD